MYQNFWFENKPSGNPGRIEEENFFPVQESQSFRGSEKL
jgi:hypothetical protein